MKIGVWLGSTPKASNGGAFSYSDRLIKLLDTHDFGEGVEICFLSLHKSNAVFNKEVIYISQIPRLLYKFTSWNNKLYQKIERLDKFFIKKRGLLKILPNFNIGIVYYLTQSYCLDSNFPFIATNWDIGHCSTYSFPEIIWDGNTFENREQYYRTILPKALMILCDSETGKQELLKYTFIGEHKIRILPIFAGEVSELQVDDEIVDKIIADNRLEKYKYFFYPAQFWAHKNHYNLIKAFVKFSSAHPDYKLVLCGSDKGNKKYITNLVNQFNLNEKVVFLGFVPIETIYCMYKYATALVMASHFGPTNMPPIEAMEIGCPVICSDLGGHREILGDSAVYFNSFDSESIFNAMILISDNQDEYRNRINKQGMLTEYTVNKSMKKLSELFKETIEIRKNWDVERC